MNAARGSAASGDRLPTGTVTFLFTDIEGSTERWDCDRAAMENAVRRHDALMREKIGAHGGHVFKTIGDAFCAAFARPEDAANATIAAQTALAAEDFSSVDGVRVRMALHTGTADERDGDYYGPVVNRVARLLAIGHGGQTLVSGVTADLVAGALASHASLRDLGEHRLKDLARPEYVYQLVVPSLAAEFPPLRSLDALPNNLPLQLSSFVGRETEVAEITGLLAKNRVVTLVGSGGIGKTRTSLQVAANLLDGSGDGVWFVELAPLLNGDLIATTIATAMGLTLPGEGDPVDQLVRALHRKHALLVFDNCEHLVEATARVVAAIVRGCAKVAVLASSRQGLGIAGEATYRMPPLGVPRDAVAMSLSAANASRYAALALFAERARASDNRFELTDDNAPIVADICRRLDGIALAIELAAARVKILSPRQLRDKLDERFRVLTGGSRDLLPRQQTLRALIDWSHDLLDERERTLFRRLGIFVDGFTLEGASAVANGEDLDEFDVLDLLASLVEKSLVLAEPSGDALRYRLLESTRAYALEKLCAADERNALAARHLRWLRDWFAEIADRRETSAQNAEIYAALLAELDGLRFALDDALARADVVAGAELLAAIGTCWTAANLLREATIRNQTYLEALPRGETALFGKLSVTTAQLIDASGEGDRGLELSATACEYARSGGDTSTLSYALLSYAGVAIRLSKYSEAETALTEMASLPQLSTRARTLMASKRLHMSWSKGDLESAARGFEQNLAEQRARGNVHNVHVSVYNLAEVEHERGRTARAIELALEILPSVRAGYDPRLLAALLSNLSGYLAARDDSDGAATAAIEAIAALPRVPENGDYAHGPLQHLALVDSLQARFQRAARLEGFIDAAFGSAGGKQQHTDRTTRDRLNAILDEHLAPDDRARLAAEGAALTLEAAVALALAEHPATEIA